MINDESYNNYVLYIVISAHAFHHKQIYAHDMFNGKYLNILLYLCILFSFMFA